MAKPKKKNGLENLINYGEVDLNQYKDPASSSFNAEEYRRRLFGQQFKGAGPIGEAYGGNIDSVLSLTKAEYKSPTIRCFPPKIDRLVPPVVSTRFIIGDLIGQGSWGKVYLAYDRVLEGNVAIKVLEPTETSKEKMKKRGITEREAIMRENATLMAMSHVVPRWIEEDRQGRMFIVMPVYKRFLDDLLGDNEKDRKYLNHGLTLDQVTNLCFDLFNGVDDVHSKLKKPHGDIKPDNFAIENDTGHALISDLGNATTMSIGTPSRDKSGMGFRYTKAPEICKENGQPTWYTDIYSVGSLMYRMFTGKYLLEDELDAAEDPDKFLSEMTKERYDTMLKERLKKVPKGFRDIIGKALDYDPYHRYFSASEMSNEFYEILQRTNKWEDAKRQIKKIAIPALSIGISLGALVYAATSAMNIAPSQTPLHLTRVQGPLFPGSALGEKPLEFVRENIVEHPEINMTTQGENERLIKDLSGKEPSVGYMLRQYQEALHAFGITKVPPVTNEQATMYESVFGPKSADPWGALPLEVAAQTIKSALEKTRTADGKIDLEDACVMARLGENTLNRAKLLSRSNNFKSYINAKDNRGQYVIPKNERDFILT